MTSAQNSDLLNTPEVRFGNLPDANSLGKEFWRHGWAPHATPDCTVISAPGAKRCTGYRTFGVRPTGAMPACHSTPAALLDTERVLFQAAVRNGG